MSINVIEPTPEAAPEPEFFEYAGMSYSKYDSMMVPVAITKSTILELITEVTRFQLARCLIDPSVQYLANVDGTYTAIISSYQEIKKVIKGVSLNG